MQGFFRGSRCPLPSWLRKFGRHVLDAFIEPHFATWTAGCLCVIYFLSISMKHKRTNEAPMVEFLQEKGEFFGRTLSADWLAPESVKLSYGILRIRSTRQYWSDSKPRRSTR